MTDTGKQVGVNCFGLNTLLHNDFEGTFQKLREIGFTSVEPLVVFPQAIGMPAEMIGQRLKMAGQDGAFWEESLAKERIAYLRSLGFEVPGIHLGLAGMARGGVEAVLPFAAQFATENGIEYIVHSPQKRTLKEIEPDVRTFRKWIPILKEQGTELIFHCHYHEFEEDQGDTPFAYVMREVPDLRVELDVGWVCYAGVDVIKVMEEYKERIAIVHLKDIVEDAAQKGPKDIFTAIGEGSIPLREILEKAQELPLSYTGLVIDQDASFGDMLEELERGYQNIQSM